jgi:hypothetical protein
LHQRLWNSIPLLCGKELQGFQIAVLRTAIAIAVGDRALTTSVIKAIAIDDQERIKTTIDDQESRLTAIQSRLQEEFEFDG